MLQRLSGGGVVSGGGVLSRAGARRLSLSALALLLLLTWQASRSINDPHRLLLGLAATGLIGLAWCAQLRWPTVLGVWLLGLGGAALVLLVPGAGAVFAIVAAIVTAAMRIPPRAGAITASVLGGVFVLASGFADGWSSP